MSEPVGPMPVPPEVAPMRGQEKVEFDDYTEEWSAWEQAKAEYWNGGAYQQINAAVAAAPAAIAASGAGKWESGVAVTQQQVDDGYANWSPTDGQTYRLTAAKTDVQNVTDPALDSSGDWTKLSFSVPNIPVTASGAVTAGKPAVITGNNTAQQVKQTSSETLSAQKALAVDAYSGRKLIRWNENSQRGALLFQPSDGNWGVVGVILNDEDELVTVGSWVRAPNDDDDPQDMQFFVVTDQLMVFCRDGGSPYAGRASIFNQAENGALSYGRTLDFAGTNEVSSYGGQAAYIASENTMVFAFAGETSKHFRYSYFGLDTDGHIEVKVNDGTVDAAAVHSSGGVRCVYDPTQDKVVFTWVNNSSLDIYCRTATVGASSLSMGSNRLVFFGTCYNHGLAYDDQIDKPVIFYRDASNTGKMRSIDVSGSTPAEDTEQTFYGSGAYWQTKYWESVNLLDAEKLLSVHGYDTNGTSSEDALTATTTAWSGGTPTNTFTDILAAQAGGPGHSVCYLNSAKKAIMTYDGNSLSDPAYYRVLVDASSNLNSENFAGLFAGSASDGGSVEITPPGAVNSNQSGLTANQRYYVQPDGTIATTKGLPVIVAGLALSATEILVGA